MAYIKQIDEDQAQGTLRKIYDEALKRAGGVANIIKVQSLDPYSNRRSIQFYVSLMKAENSLRAMLSGSTRKEHTVSRSRHAFP